MVDIKFTYCIGSWSMGDFPLSNLKIYRNVYIKGFNKVPYQLMTGRHTLLYSGKIICGLDKPPDYFDKSQDIFLGTCDCDFHHWKNLKRILK